MGRVVQQGLPLDIHGRHQVQGRVDSAQYRWGQAGGINKTGAPVDKKIAQGR